MGDSKRVRCKFQCVAVTSRKGWSGTETPFLSDAKFQVVCDGSEESRAFFSSTPSGEISVASLRPDLFEPGQNYYVDFTPAGA